MGSAGETDTQSLLPSLQCWHGWSIVVREARAAGQGVEHAAPAPMQIQHLMSARLSAASV